MFVNKYQDYLERRKQRLSWEKKASYRCHNICEMPHRYILFMHMHHVPQSLIWRGLYIVLYLRKRAKKGRLFFILTTFPMDYGYGHGWIMITINAKKLPEQRYTNTIKFRVNNLSSNTTVSTYDKFSLQK